MSVQILSLKKILLLFSGTALSVFLVISFLQNDESYSITLAPLRPTLEGTIYDSEIPTDLGEGYEERFKSRYLKGGMYLPAIDNVIDRVPNGVSLEPSVNEPSKTVFMFRSDLSSPYTDIFAVQEKALQICDKDSKIDGCSIHLKGNYGFERLSVKLLETLKIFCVDPHKTDLYIKVDDDLIISKRDLDYLARMVHYSKDCKVAGLIIHHYTFYWPIGRIYFFKKEVLERACALIPSFTVPLHNEDIVFGALLNSTNSREFCQLDSARLVHKKYEDGRLKIEYKDIHPEIFTNG